MVTTRGRTGQNPSIHTALLQHQTLNPSLSSREFQKQYQQYLYQTAAMPKNKGKGGKNRRRGKNENEETKRDLLFKEEGQEYGQVLRMLGNGRCEVYCFDGKNRLAHIRGKMRKKVWVSAGDIVLLGMRDYQEDKVDIIHKYNADEARNLKAFGELPETAKINETAIDLTMEGGSDSEDEIGVDFDEI
ncbi:eukaryotic translation initiation factor 1a [Nannochloropsis oceanica]